MSSEGVSRISVSVPPELLRKFDEATERMGYENRSIAVQAAMRDLVTESKWECKKMGRGIGAIVMIYDHEVRNLEEEITEAQHQHIETVVSTMHVHLDKENCLEIIAVKGKADEIRSLSDELKTKKGIKQLKLAIATI